MPGGLFYLSLCWWHGKFSSVAESMSLEILLYYCSPVP